MRRLLPLKIFPKTKFRRKDCGNTEQFRGNRKIRINSRLLPFSAEKCRAAFVRSRFFRLLQKVFRFLYRLSFKGDLPSFYFCKIISDDFYSPFNISNSVLIFSNELFVNLLNMIFENYRFFIFFFQQTKI